MITSRSLHHSNIAFVFDEHGFSLPDPAAVAALYGGERARGAQFLDDPAMRTKILILPALKIRITLEGTRLRIDDESQEEPEKSNFLAEALFVYQRLSGIGKLIGFGFNLDVYFRFNNVLPVSDAFEYFFGRDFLKYADLRAFGVQFTLERAKKYIKDLPVPVIGNIGILDTVFVKVPAPLEIAMHINRHFPVHELPPLDSLRILLQNCYNESEEIAKQFESSF